MNQPQTPRILIVGGGFGGLNAARALRRANAEITLLDRQNHHLFQPLLYQVATAALSPGDIAAPLRKVLERQRNCTVHLAEVASIDLHARRAITTTGATYDYDYLVLAAGSQTAYFGHDDWPARAPGLKTIDDALDIRRRYLLAFERAETESDPQARRRALTFAIVGAGPTGVEMAGAMAELARQTMRRSFRRLDTRDARIILIDGNHRVLETFPPDLSARAARDLERLGVELRLGRHVTAVEADAITIGAGPDAARIETTNIIWAAGVQGVPLAATLGVPLDRAGRVIVNPDLSIPNHAEAFVIGDLALAKDASTGKQTPGVAQAAMQAGRHAGRIIANEIASSPPPPRGGGQADAQRQPGGGASPHPVSPSQPPLRASVPSSLRPFFHYKDKGELATIGRARAVANLNRLHLGGYPAWLLWALVHITYLIGYRSKLLTLLNWAWLYLFYDRGVRLITGRDTNP
ncbi:MAG: NAD(P)/FAD-dependent oxidoreductase [Phycisphaerales bacterium]|nr:NAD(P)/FAD-dependent oxidoreductase [Phycisphaerales bacterium]